MSSQEQGPYTTSVNCSVHLQLTHTDGRGGAMAARGVTSGSGVTDDQLRLALKQKGVEVGPITDSTREVYLRKWRQLLKESNTANSRDSLRPQEKSERDSKTAEDEEKDGEAVTHKPALPLLPSTGVVALLDAQFNNPLHVASDTAFLFPQGHVISVSRAVLAITCDTLSPLLYNQEEPYPVTVVTLTGASCMLLVRGSELVTDLKLKISLRLGVTTREVQLIHQQDTLNDYMSLRQQGILPGSSVHLVLVSNEEPLSEVTYIGPVTNPTLSIAHLQLGLGLEKLWHSPPPDHGSRAHLPPHLQHIVHVHDVPYQTMIVVLKYLYSGEYPLTPIQGSNPLLLATCSILAEHLKLKDLSGYLLTLVKPILSADSAVMLANVAERLQYAQLHNMCVRYLENHK